jgi:hypothetical protein
MSKIKGTFQEHPWLDQKNDKALRRIMEEGEIECMLCRGKNEQLGSGMCTPGFTKKHHAAQHASVDQKTKQTQQVAVAAENANKRVSAAIAAKVLRQPTLMEVGVAIETDDDAMKKKKGKTLFLASLVSGGTTLTVSLYTPSRPCSARHCERFSLCALSLHTQRPSLSAISPFRKSNSSWIFGEKSPILVWGLVSDQYQFGEYGYFYVMT